MKNQLCPIAVCNNKKDIPNPSIVNLRIILSNPAIIIRHLANCGMRRQSFSDWQLYCEFCSFAHWALKFYRSTLSFNYPFTYG
jgi:hypothetical protein